MIETAKRVSIPFVSILFAYYLITFEFQVIGQIMFSGKVKYSLGSEESIAAGDGLEIVFNFNDFFGSLMVLTAFLISNNWNTMVDLYSVVTGWQTIVRIYFSFFFFLVALIILNIITSFVVEIYDALGDEVDLKLSKERNSLKL